MTAIIRCVEGPQKGRDIVLDPARPVEMDVRRGESEAAGKLSFRFEDGSWIFDNGSHLVSKVNGEKLQNSVLHDGDQIRVGRFVFEVRLGDDVGDLDQLVERHFHYQQVSDKDETVPAMPVLPQEEKTDTDPADEADEGSTRRSDRSQRRISASQDAVVAEGEKPGLFSKVGRVFRRKDGRSQRLEELENERDGLLTEVGRAALLQQGGIGLPENFLVRLSQGERIGVDLRALNAQVLERFRRNRERLAYLDAEVQALRQELGLEPEPRRAGVSDRQLPTEKKEQADRAFRAMDAMNTEELAGGSTEIAPIEPDPPRASVRRRRRRRR